MQRSGQGIADTKAVDEVKEIRDRSEAMRAYAKQAKNKQLEVDAAEIRIRAERRIGELMKAQKDAGLLPEGRPKNGSDDNPFSKPITLAKVGVNKSLADRARKLAAVPEAGPTSRSWSGGTTTSSLMATGGL